MSDPMLSQRQPGRRAPKRQDWLPNRMFDPVNNPFAIQNLLAREREKQDTAFHVDVDGRPQASYAGNPLLKEKEILPPKDFASNRLLEETTRFDHAFHAEYEDVEHEYESEEPDDDNEPSVAAMPADAVLEATEAVSEEASDELHAAPTDANAAEAQLNDRLATISESAVDVIAVPNAQPGQESDVESAPAVADTPEMAEASALTDSEAAAQVTESKADSVDEALAATDVTNTEPEADKPVPAELSEPASELEQVAEQPEHAPEVEPGNESATEVTEPASTAAADAEDTDAVAEQLASSPEPTTPNDTKNSSAISSAEAATTDEAPAPIASEHEADAEIHQEPSGVTDTDDVAAEAPAAAVEATAEVPADPPGLSNEAIESLLQAACEEAREQGRQEAREAAYQEGLQAGRDQAKAELQQSFDDKIAQVEQILEGLQRLSEDPDTLFEPMKKLAVHLAEQLVRGELTQSPQTISRLVDNCLRELAASGEKAVIVHLNPEDLEQYKPLIASFGDSIVLRPDATLARGSVRASLDGSVVEDLIDRRVKGIQKSLSQPVAGSWRPALSNTLSQRAQPPQPRADRTTDTANTQLASEANEDPMADDEHAESLMTDESPDTSGNADVTADELHGENGNSAAP